MYTLLAHSWLTTPSPPPSSSLIQHLPPLLFFLTPSSSLGLYFMSLLQKPTLGVTSLGVWSLTHVICHFLTLLCALQGLHPTSPGLSHQKRSINQRADMSYVVIISNTASAPAGLLLEQPCAGLCDSLTSSEPKACLSCQLLGFWFSSATSTSELREHVFSTRNRLPLYSFV